MTQRTIDTHTHILTEETAALITKASPKTPVTITPIDKDGAALDVGGTVYRIFPTGGFDIPRRLQDMDATGVDVHVLSATPQTYLYGLGDELSPIVAAIQNDQMAKHIAAHPTRFMGIATLPIGYADGWTRQYWPGASALVRGRRIPLVGRVSMDSVCADATDVAADGELGLDDVFVLLGSQGAERITPDELASIRGSLPYEVFCAFGPRLGRATVGATPTDPRLARPRRRRA